MTANLRVQTLAKSVTRKHGFNQCHKCADELRRVLIAAGVKGAVLRLRTKGGRGNIVMKDPSFFLPFAVLSSAAIATNGQHFGVQVGDYVFDNIHRAGIPLTKWRETFDCDVHDFDLEIEHF